ncbi:hypothetical protein CJ193_003595 [Pseudoglutamicibacter albus]|uniref:hypothetical protein n=1 Tax=Pseudoglutamicibacter albus TaxID=98671 RepID=UPI000C779585|nr:hypothetical protein [Pseudoglutamicibacter albus]PKY80816.1 hypothetical protein CYJ35_03550 [Pseudoglutamicibacter albus]WIK84925.1 hypothetical protein CJ193_003595 [Pseudoglutamicibacter albus]
MEPSFLVLGVVVGVVAIVLGLRSAGKRARKNLQANTTPERAREVSELLDVETHKAVYARIAQNDLMGAAQLIKSATDRSNTDCITDVVALQQYPQVKSQAAFREVETPEFETPELDTPEHEASEASSAEPHADVQDSIASGPVDSSDLDVPSDQDWAIPEDWAVRYGDEAAASERHMNFTHNDGEREHSFSTQDIPAAERDQLMAKLRDRRFDEASEIIGRHIDLDQGIIRRALEVNLAAGSGNGVTLQVNVGDGRTVTFSTDRLSETERGIFMTAMHMEDVDAAVDIFMRHTGVDEEHAREVLQQVAHLYKRGH